MTKEHGTTEEEMEGPASSWGSKEQETRLTLHEHGCDDDDDDGGGGDDDDDDDDPKWIQGKMWNFCNEVLHPCNKNQLDALIILSFFSSFNFYMFWAYL